MSDVDDLTPNPSPDSGEGSSAPSALSAQCDGSAPSLSLRPSKARGPSLDQLSPPADVRATLALMQLGDSLFPSGAFAHSFGLEQLAREGMVRRPEELQRFVESVLRRALAPCDAVAALRGFEAALDGEPALVIAADRALFRAKAPYELRAASLATGRRLVDEVSPHIDAPLLNEYASALKTDRSLGMQAVAFGVVCAALGVEDTSSVVASLLMLSATGLLQASMRLLPVSHRDVQAILHDLRPVIAGLASGLAAGGSRPLRSFQPLQDVASMRHESASARLFAS